MRYVILSKTYDEYVEGSFRGTPIPSKILIEFANKVLKSLVSDFGWKREGKKVCKNFYGGKKGNLNPKGNRIVFAYITDTQGTICAYFGGETIKSLLSLNILSLSQTPKAYAKFFVKELEKWAEHTKEKI